MVFVIRFRRAERFDAEGKETRSDAISRYEDLWQGLRQGEDWAVALFECPDETDIAAAIAVVEAGGGQIIAQRDKMSNDAAMRDLRSILEPW